MFLDLLNNKKHIPLVTYQNRLKSWKNTQRKLIGAHIFYVLLFIALCWYDTGIPNIWLLWIVSIIAATTCVLVFDRSAKPKMAMPNMKYVNRLKNTIIEEVVNRGHIRTTVLTSKFGTSWAWRLAQMVEELQEGHGIGCKSSPYIVWDMDNNFILHFYRIDSTTTN